ncbi:DUF4823 domain-containing protein [Geothermobacter hydrogeniphilus]|uniref:DUF4823 domain-containing protein n=1 Tax=Geothermobacter hydrogeniphilus TaxID=1969733 RepID=A0A2K2HBK3_9BACT|nr:DUF4823 domain-containing protein [Geothermobacter hydrogeniphilus]PNU20620.1 DUF4823 domain-containing protein [Geothermobacter hydrogeniphilus]
MRKFSIFVSIFLLVGCTASYQQLDLAIPQQRLEKSKSVLIATPKNGFYGSTEYNFSGQMTAIAINAAFSKFSPNVRVDSRCSELSCLKKTSGDKFDYLVIPEILHWEERATEWSGKPDRIEVKLTIYDSITDAVLAATTIKGKSKWATFGGDHPQDLLPDPLNKYVSSLY